MNKKKIMSLILIVSASASPFLSKDEAYATNSKRDNDFINKNVKNYSKGKVVNITTSLRIRSGAGTNYSTIGYLKNGQEFDVLGKSGSWYKIKVRGKEGFIHKDYVKVISNSDNNKPNAEAKKGQVVNVETALRVRSGPSLSKSIKGYVYNNDKVEIIGKTDNWYKIKKGSLEGYTSAKYIKEISEEKPTEPEKPIKPEKPTEIKGTGKVINITSTLNIRSGAGTNYSVVGRMHNGDTFEVIGKSGKWYKIKKGSINGYIYEDYVQIIDSKPTEPEKPIKPEKPTEIKGTGKVINITSTLNIRSGAGTNYSVVGRMHNGDTFEVIGKSGKWYKIKKGSINGYIYEDYVQIIDSKPTEPEKPIKPEKPEVQDKIGIVHVNSSLNVRKEASSSSSIIGHLRNGDRVTIKGEKNGFYKIQTSSILEGYVSKSYITISDGEAGGEVGGEAGGETDSNLNGKVIYTNYNMSLDEYIKLQQSRVPSYSYGYFEKYINPIKVTNNYQFLRVDKFRDINVTGLNSYLESKDAGVLKGKASAFRNSAKKYDLDPIYIVSQSIHETGYGKSKLAKGVEITEIANPDKEIRNSKGQLIGYEMIKLDEPVTVYNLFGIGAYDNSEVFPNRALILGTTYAYNKRWTSVEKAIEGAVEFVSLNYVNNSRYEQNTLYKMRYMHDIGNVWHQYATSPWYAQSIGNQMAKMSNLYKNGTEFLYDKPKFNNNKNISFRGLVNDDKEKKKIEDNFDY